MATGSLVLQHQINSIHNAEQKFTAWSTGLTHAKLVSLTSPNEYSSRPTTGAEQRCLCWLQRLIRKWSRVNHQFQFHTQIAYKPTYISIIGTDIKFNHTNSAIHSSGHSHSLFTSASDYASAQWRLVVHILITCSPHVNSAGSRLPYMVFVVANWQ